MTTTPTEPVDLYPWLPLGDVLDRLQLDTDTSHADTADRCRRAAAGYCEDQRADLWVDVLDETGTLVVGSTFVATDRVVEAGHLITGRLYARRSSPAGVASFAEFGPADILRFDPDAAMLLGTGRHATPKVG